MLLLINLLDVSDNRDKAHKISATASLPSLAPAPRPRREPLAGGPDGSDKAEPTLLRNPGEKCVDCFAL